MIKHWLEPGPGRHRCLKCGVYISARLDRCMCGWYFDEPPPPPKRWVVLKSRSGGMVVEEEVALKALKNEEEIMGTYDYLIYALDAASNLEGGIELVCPVS